MGNSSENSVFSILKQMILNLSTGMHTKLIVLFVFIKVVPLVLIAMLAWSQSSNMADELQERLDQLSITLENSLQFTGEVAVEDSMQALEIRVRNEFERTTTDLADRIADMLYDVDDDLLFLASIPPSKELYEAFIRNHTGDILVQSEYVWSNAEKAWVMANPKPFPQININSNAENDAFHYRAPDPFEFESVPLYDEIAFLDLEGNQVYKAVSGDKFSDKLLNVSDKANTYVKAENYFAEAQKLKAGEIYVSDVTGAYVGTPILGVFSPENAAKKNIPFESYKDAAFASTENPHGKRFEGIIRWITPVEQNGERVGYITIAYNHDHIMEVTNRILPTDDRYGELGDPIEGNYAFIWDHLGKNIVHPRHHSIVGFDPETGEQAVPWLEQSIYDKWQQSGESYADFIVDYPVFENQSRSKKPAAELTAQQLMGLDCRYLNNAPQCVGWFDLAEEGGSGSVHILWTGLVKITTAAAIPYYTGPYAEKKVGFGFVAISASLDTLQAPAFATKDKLDTVIRQADYELDALSIESEEFILDSLFGIAQSLTISTLIMCILVIIIAVMLASAITRSVTLLLEGFTRFRNGERQFRFYSDRTDELGALADSFDELADSLVQSVNEPQVILDADKNIIFMNEAAEVWYDKDLDDVVGAPFFSIAYYEESSPYCPMSLANDKKEAEIMFSDSKQVYFQDSFIRTSVSDYEEDEEGYIITTRDMTNIVENEKDLDAQRQLLDTIFTSSPDMMWLKDAVTQKFLMANPRYANISGKHVSEYMGKTSYEIYANDHALALETETYDSEVIQKGRTLLREQTVRFQDGHTEILEILRTPMYNQAGQISSILGIARDVTSRVEAQNALLQIQHDLEDALTNANAANAAKSDFLARMSHEIRTPMNAILGLTDIVRRTLEKPDADIPKILVQLQHIERSSKHLLGLLNDILDLSKIEAGKIEVELTQVDLPALVQAVDPIIRPRCEEKYINYNVNFDSRITSRVVSDPLRLRQVLINLLGNAVKFTPENGTITLNLNVLEQQANRINIRFEVRDSGIGISEEGISKLFTPFEQAEANTARMYGGTGLGLSISNSIINLLGNQIRVESTLGQGSNFYFDLWFDCLNEDNTLIVQHIDFEKSEVVEQVQEFSAPVDLQTKRILVADDVELNRLIIMEMLKNVVGSIEEAPDGKDAIEMFNNSEEGYYDLILMDALMPIINGYDASKAIRELNRPDAKTIPIIAVTANAFKEDVDKALACGMNAHLAKPVDYDKLLELVKQ